MAPQPKDIVAEFFAAFGQRDLDKVATFFTDDVVYTVIGDPKGTPPLDPESLVAIPWLGQYHGPAGAREFIAHLQANIDVIGFGPQTVIVEDENVAVFGTFSYRSKSTGRDFHSNYAIRIKMRGDKICEYFFHENTYAVAAAFRESGQWTMHADARRFPVPA